MPAGIAGTHAQGDGSRRAGYICFGGDGRGRYAFEVLWVGRALRSYDQSIATALSLALRIQAKQRGKTLTIGPSQCDFACAYTGPAAALGFSASPRTLADG
jgi:hypothetical protein